MAPRGLKAFVAKSAKGKLCKGKYVSYRAIDDNGNYDGPYMAGITKRLASRLYSSGELDASCLKSSEWVPGAWRGDAGGLRRGRAVDAQVSRLSGASAAARKSASKFQFSSLFFCALDHAGLEPLLGQRVVLDRDKGIATACDVLCFRKKDNALVVVELKTGFSGNRTMAATVKGAPQTFAAPCATAADCLLHRHLAQLAATHRLLVAEPGLKNQLKALGVERVEGALLYVTSTDTQLHALPDWWVRRGKRLVELLGK